MRSQFGGGVPTTVSVSTSSGQRAAKWRAMVPPHLRRDQMKALDAELLHQRQIVVDDDIDASI